MNKVKKIFLRFYPVLILFVLSLIFFYPAIFQNKIPLPTDALVGAHIPWTEFRWPEFQAGVPIKNQEITDAVSQFYPWRALVGDFWRHAKAPLWNYYMFLGTPFLATLHSAALYPLNVIYLFFSDANSWTILVYLQILLSMLFMYLLLKEYKLKNEASMFGAIAFGFSGYMIAWLQFATGGHAGLWLPLLIYFEHKYLTSKKLTWLVAIPVVFLFIFTAGDFQVPLYIVVTYFLYGIFFLAKQRKIKKDFIKFTSLIFVTFLFGIMLSSVQLLPTLELFKNSVRLNDPYIDQYFFGLMNWQKAAQFLWPDFFGNIVTRNYWGLYGFHEYMGYTGIIGVVFVFYSLTKKKEIFERFYWILLILALMFLFPTPIAFLPYKLHIPALGTSSASRILFLVDFSLAILSAYGFDKYINGKSAKRIIFYLLAISFGLFLGFGISYKIMNDPVTPVTNTVTNIKVTLKNMLPGTLLLIMLLFLDTLRFNLKRFIKVNNKLALTFFIYAILFLFSSDMIHYAIKNRPFMDRKFLYPVIPIIDYLINQPKDFRIGGGLPTNMFIPFKLESVEGYDPIYPKLNSDFYSIVDWGNRRMLTGRYGLVHYFTSPFLNYANLKYVIDYKKDDKRQINDDGHFYPGVELPRFKEAFYDRRVSILENTQNLPFIWLSGNFEVIRNDDDLISKVLDSQKPILALNTEPNFKSQNINPDYSVSNIKKDYNQITFKVSTSETALAFISESNYPGWVAYIDGVKTSIYKANYLFQSIVIPSGSHQVVLSYEPESFKLGTIFFLSGLALLVFLELYFLKTDRKYLKK